MSKAKRNRDAWIEKVMSHNEDWRKDAQQMIMRLSGEEVTGEEIRIQLTLRGIEPDHHNAWGGFIAGLVRAGLLVDTGKVKHMMLSRSHARRTPVWRVV